MTVKYTLKRGQPLTQEQLMELDALEDRSIVYDEDCPKLTEEELRQFKRVNPRSNGVELRRITKAAGAVRADLNQ